MECLDKVIKLSASTCECYEQGSPSVDLEEGKSNLYLDRLEGFNLETVKAATDCNSGGLWEKMYLARQEAEQALKADLLSCLQNNVVHKRPNYEGMFGQRVFNNTLNLTQSVIGQVMKFPRIVGAKVRLKKIGLMLNSNASVSVSIYNNDENATDAIGTYTINTTANTVSEAELSDYLDLPLWSENVNNLEYYIVFNRSGFQPKNNSHGCIPCGTYEKNPGWKRWINITGIRGNNTDYANFTTSEELNGLILTGMIFCDATRLICSDEYPLNFETDGYAMKIAETVRYKAGAILADDILSTNNLNRYIMLEREALYGKRNYYRKKYEDLVAWLCANTPYINNDCFACKPPTNAQKGAILS